MRYNCACVMCLERMPLVCSQPCMLGIMRFVFPTAVEYVSRAYGFGLMSSPRRLASLATPCRTSYRYPSYLVYRLISRSSALMICRFATPSNCKSRRSIELRRLISRISTDLLFFSIVVFRTFVGLVFNS